MNDNANNKKKIIVLVLCVIVVVTAIVVGVVYSQSTEEPTTTEYISQSEAIESSTSETTTKSTTESTTEDIEDESVSNSTTKQTTAKQTTHADMAANISVEEVLNYLETFYGDTYEVNSTIYEDGYQYFAVFDKRGNKYASVKVNLTSGEMIETITQTGQTNEWNIFV